VIAVTLGALPRPLALFTFALALGLTACAGGADPSPEPGLEAALTLAIEHVIGGDPIRMGSPYVTRYKQDVTFDHVRYWLTGVTLASGEDEYEVPASYYLVEQTRDPSRERLRVTLTGVPEGSYDRLVLHIGVDPLHNAAGAALSGELTRGIGMDFAQGGGFAFFQAGGSFEQKDLHGHFEFRIGSDVLYKKLTAELPSPIALAEGAEVVLPLRAEIDRLFAGVTLSEDTRVEGGTVDSAAAQVAGNYSRMFRLVMSDGEVPLTATSPNLDAPEENGAIPTDITPPSLTAPVVDLPGALFCGAVEGRPASEERACLTPFGHALSSGAAYDAGLFTFVTQNGEPVRAASPGVVSDITYIDHSHLTHSDIYRVTIRPSKDSAFFLEYRNVKDLKVSEGDTVAAGQALGGAGDYFAAPVGLVSFGVRRAQEVTQRLCPTRFMAADQAGIYEAALAVSNEAWPALAEASLCSSASLACKSGEDGPCEAPSEFAAADGDIDEGRRIYKTSCASCHGEKGEGGVGPKLCAGAACSCKDCGSHAELAASIEADMPPEGHCDAKCSADVAAFILHDFAAP
jgi:hypothetical protein